MAERQRAERRRNRELRSASAAHDQTIRTLELKSVSTTRRWMSSERDFRTGAPEAVEDYFTEVLALSQYPAGFPHQYQVAYGQNPVSSSSQSRLPPVEVFRRKGISGTSSHAARSTMPGRQGNQGTVCVRDPSGRAPHHVGVLLHYRGPATSSTRWCSTGSCPGPTALPGRPKNFT